MAAPTTDIEDIAALHAAAERAGATTYRDPGTGYRVFTAATLCARGRCCGCGCRHCPYSHANVPLEKRAARIKAPALLRGSLAELAGGDGIDVLLWSGGKDSFLAARALCRERRSRRRLVLLTTFEGTSRQVAHQEVSIDAICRQAETLGVPLVGCPLWTHAPYAERLGEAIRFIVQWAAPAPVLRVCTGDLHLEHINRWREEHLGQIVSAIGATLHSPLWHTPYEALLRDLAASGTPCRVCATEHPAAVPLGALFGGALLATLDPEIDAFGENGEFHTLAEVWDASVDDPLLSPESSGAAWRPDGAPGASVAVTEN